MEEKLLLDRYRILAKVGEGATAKVYRAFDTKIGRDVAIKEIKAGPSTAARVIREIRTVATLNHPNIVTVFEFEETKEYYYIIMEYLDGVSLREVLLKISPLSRAQAVEVGIQVCEALNYAHSFEIIHRDIKPENIMILKNKRIIVTDFGIARLIKRGYQERRIVGTLGYMSPEQITGRYIDETADIFSIGIVLYELLTGKNPLYAETLKETALKILKLNPPPPSSINPNIPKELDTIILKAIAKDTDIRFQTAKEFKEKLLPFRSDVSSEEVLKSMSQVSPSKREVSPELKGISGIRTLINTFLKKRSRILKNIFIAISTALFSYLFLPQTGFYPQEILLAAPIVLFMLSLFYPVFALWLFAFTFIPPVISQSLLFGITSIILLTIYCSIFTEEEPALGFLPLYAFALSSLNLDFLFPLLVGLFASPGIAFLIAASGIFFIEIYDVSQAPLLRYLQVNNDYLGLLKIESSENIFSAFKSIFMPFVNETMLWAQLVIWGITSALIGFPLTFMKKKMIARIIGIVCGCAFFIFAYILLVSYLNLTEPTIGYFINNLFPPALVAISYIFFLQFVKK